ncbi:ABC transporter substrate-binding protein [Bosea sp. 685]|uniref:ABC transporter substrate-binding protein n=1 Tax=Bosea sp. 685 TaxID=3080057 RepID=UPI002892C080|nr:ABC transporter substrate-binding protein [Bosea sp. 685]WNJ88361.1 ABC transporter substrate-binding protein [Bosea sp. 685]
MKTSLRLTIALAGTILATSAARADITVGFVTALSGPGASIGIPYAKGMAAAYEYVATVNGEKVRLIQLDDTSDPSTAARNARKLVEEEKVDILIGTAQAPAAIAMMAVSAELKVPMISVAPVVVPPTTDRWGIAVPQLPSLMFKAVTDRMTKDGVKSLAFIGFSDAWGDLVYTGAKAAEDRSEVKLVANERYARTDTSVTGQVLKIVAARPDAVFNGGSATQGALPLLALAERGYKGKIYGTPALLNADFIRVGGKAAEGILVSAGPVIVAEQLPDTHFSKKLSLAFRASYLKVNGTETTDGFSAYSFDAWLIFTEAAKRAMAKAKPGTPEFRTALKDEIFATKELAGVHAIYNFKPDSAYGVDERSLVLVRLSNGTWKYEP